MKKRCTFFFLFLMAVFSAQQVTIKTLLTDSISIRAIQLYDHKVWYVGTASKFGYVNLKNLDDRMQMHLSEKNLEFRTLAQNRTNFYAFSIGSPAYLFYIPKKDPVPKMLLIDTAKTAFYDAFKFDRYDRGLAISDPNEKRSPRNMIFFPGKPNQKVRVKPIWYFPGEAHFAASNTSIAMAGGKTWIASGGTKARIFKFSWSNPFKWQVFETPFIQGTDSQGIYSLDFLDKNFGIAVGGDYKHQAENINNIATTHDGGMTWQIQASGKNGGYKTCVKIRPKSKGKDIIAVGDQNIEFSQDFGQSWKTISTEKGLYVCEWLDRENVILAGKNRIILMNLKIE